MKLKDAIKETDKLRPNQYPSGKVLKYAMRYVRPNKQLFIQAEVASGTEKGKTYQVRLVFNGILSSDKRTNVCRVKYKDLDGSIYYIQKPTSDHHILTRCSCFTGDTLIPLADGYSVPIKDLVGKKEFFVYSFDQNTNKIVIGKGHSAKVYGKNEKILKLTLDNGNVIRCTEDHLFMLKNGEYIQAVDLKPNQSLMPLYRKLSNTGRNFMNGYEEVLQPITEGYDFTHHLSADYNSKYRENESWMRYDKSTHKISYEIPKDLKGKKPVRHHKDQNKLNNSPLNVAYMFYKEHFDYHSMHKTVISEEARKKWLYRVKNFNPMKNPETVAKMVQTSRANGVYEKAHYNFYVNGEHIASSLAKNGLHHFQTQEHKDRARIQNLKLSKQGNHPFQIAAKEGRLWTQNPNNAEKLSEHSRKNVEITISQHSTGSFKAFLRSNNRDNLISNTLDWFNSLPFGRNEFTTQDIHKHIPRKYKTNGNVYKTLNKLKEFIPTSNQYNKLPIKEGSVFYKYEFIKTENLTINHKVIKIEEDGYEDVYCFTVEDYHNFAIDCDNGILQSSGVFVKNCQDFRFMWHWWLGDRKALLGPRIPYQRKTTHYPEKNPDQIPGIDKHLLTLIKKLYSIRKIRLDAWTLAYLNRPKKDITEKGKRKSKRLGAKSSTNTIRRNAR